MKTLGNYLKSWCSGNNFLSVQLHRRSHPTFVPGLGRRGMEGLCSSGKSPGKDSDWSMLSPNPGSAVAAAALLLGRVGFGFPGPGDSKESWMLGQEKFEGWMEAGSRPSCMFCCLLPLSSV